MVTIHEGCTDFILNTWIGASILTFDHGMIKCFIWIDIRLFFCLSTSSGRFCMMIYSALYNTVNLQILCKLQYAIFLFFFFCHFHREHYFFLIIGDFIYFFLGTFCNRRRRLSWNKYKFKYIISYWLELQYSYSGFILLYL